MSVERFHMPEWSEDGGFGAMDHFVYARDFDRLKTALQEISAIKDELFGGDWDEIERARNIANAALNELVEK